MAEIFSPTGYVLIVTRWFNDDEGRPDHSAVSAYPIVDWDHDGAPRVVTGKGHKSTIAVVVEMLRKGLPRVTWTVSPAYQFREAGE